jgi:SAM-dependent methyltransferase
VIPFEDFLRGLLPEPPARLLDVGCGRGELTTALAVTGHDVLGIDPAAPEGHRFRRLKLEEMSAADGTYDAIVAGFSLHHVGDLDAGLDKIVELLRPQGLLVLDEFAWDRMDETTLDWFHGQRRVLAAAGVGDAPGSLDDLRTEWDAEHVGLHGYDAMRAALDARFAERAFEWTPFLHRLVGGVATLALEQALVDTDAIRPLGFRYAGAPAS